MGEVKANPGLNRQSKPGSKAEDMLHKLYNRMKELGQPSKFEDFYPVRLDILAPLLDWSVERVTSAPSYLGPGEPTDAHADFETKTIFLNVKDISSGRVNFSFAHEIGHIILHGRKSIERMARPHATRKKLTALPSLAKRYDVEADRFAAELLMPPNAVQRYFILLFNCSAIFANSTYARNIIEENSTRSSYERVDAITLAGIVATSVPDQQKLSLVDFFDVSRKAMAIRLIELHLILN